MTKFDNRSVVELFVKQQTTQYPKGVESHTGNLWVSGDGKRLMNYSTCLVEINSEYGWIVNRTSYSVTTSKIQGYIMSAIWQRFDGKWIQENTIQVENVQMSSSYLDKAAQELIEWSKGIKPVKLINYFDVWGNKKDGWEINNLCEEAEFELHQDVDNREILTKLKEVGFLKSTVRMNMVEFEELHDFGVEIYQKKDMKPICRVEFVGGRY